LIDEIRFCKVAMLNTPKRGKREKGGGKKGFLQSKTVAMCANCLPVIVEVKHDGFRPLCRIRNQEKNKRRGGRRGGGKKRIVKGLGS